MLLGGGDLQEESRLVHVTGAGDSPPTTAGEVAGSQTPDTLNYFLKYWRFRCKSYPRTGI